MEKRLIGKTLEEVVAVLGEPVAKKWSCKLANGKYAYLDLEYVAKNTFWADEAMLLASLFGYKPSGDSHRFTARIENEVVVDCWGSGSSSF